MDVEFVNVHKWFGPVHANDEISLKIPGGAIQGLLGENGAGKSTLMKVLSGFITPDDGQILLDDQPAQIGSPSDAMRYGIGMLHQDPLDFPPMKVIDDFIIGGQRSLTPNRKEALKAFRELNDRFGFHLDPNGYVEALSVGERQQLEILRLLWLGVRVLILDEPTTGISALQKDKLFATLRELAGQGMTVIFVSHKLEEVEDLCQRVAVLRKGQLIGAAEPPYDTAKLVELMFGRPVELREREIAPAEDIVLGLENVSAEVGRLQLSDISLKVHRSEVIGLAGMEGSGQQVFLRLCCGLTRPTKGRLILNGKDVTKKNYSNFLKERVAYVPAARLEEGLIAGLTLSEHFLLSGEGTHFFIDRRDALRNAQSRIDEYSVRGQPLTMVEDLSGGNQQRCLLALLKDHLKLLLLEHPTRGLDVESALWVWEKLRDRCEEGTAILFDSADLDELLRYSDRIIVFFAGRVSPPIRTSETSVEQLGKLIGGMGWEEIVSKPRGEKVSEDDFALA